LIVKSYKYDKILRDGVSEELKYIIGFPH